MSSITGCYMVVLAMGKFNRKVSGPELQDVVLLSRSTVEKAMVALVKGGVVITTRGTNGGYDLAKPFDTITVGDLSACVDPRSQFERLLHKKSKDLLIKDL